MTTAQKVIKYIATAFAVFLVVTILSAILSGTYGLMSALGLVNTEQASITEDLKVIGSEINDIGTLKIDLAFTNLEIKIADAFKVETNNSKISFTESNGSVKIKEENKNSFLNSNDTSMLYVYLPKDILDLDEVIIKAGTGRVKIEDLKTKKLNLELGAGEAYIENIVAMEEAKIDGGVGKIELKSCEINKLKANLGMGEFIFAGKLTGKNEVDSGIGAISIDLIDNKQNYTIDVKKGLGNIMLDGQKIEMDSVYGTGENYLDIDGGIGEIKIDFE